MDARKEFPNEDAARLYVPSAVCRMILPTRRCFSARELQAGSADKFWLSSVAGCRNSIKEDALHPGSQAHNKQ